MVSCSIILICPRVMTVSHATRLFIHFVTFSPLFSNGLSSICILLHHPPISSPWSLFSCANRLKPLLPYQSCQSSNVHLFSSLPLCLDFPRVFPFFVVMVCVIPTVDRKQRGGNSQSSIASGSRHSRMPPFATLGFLPLWVVAFPIRGGPALLRLIIVLA